MKPKIMFVIDTLALGGAEKSIAELTTNLNSFECLVCVIYGNKDDFFYKHISDKNILVRFLNIEERFGFIKATLKLKREIKLYDPAIIHSTLFKSEIISRMACIFSTRILIGSFISDPYRKERLNRLSRREVLKIRLYQFLNIATIRRCNAIIAISEAIILSNTKKLFYPKSKVKVITRGRKLADYLTKEKLDLSIYCNNTTKNTFFIISTSRLLISKGILLKLDALKLLVNEGYDIHLILVGSGENEDKVKSYIVESHLENYVTFLGKRNDVPLLLKSSNLFWFASYNEGLGMSYIEAMMARCPIILSNIPAVKSNVKHLENGFLFKSGDFIDLYKKSKILIDNYEKYHYLVDRAFEDISYKYSIDNVIAQYESYYKKIMEKKS